VRVKSGGENLGTTFIVSLPISIVQTLDPKVNLQHAPAPRHARSICIPDLSGVTVMVVDDEADAIALVQRIMESCGATVHACTSATQCLAALPGLRPDVLVTDIGMPEMDGFTLIERIRGLPRDQGGATPAVALTAFASSEDRRQSMLAGFDVHVAKPVEPGELVAVVSRLARRT
jgi:CheY-like chemotaxis protein